MMFMIKRGEQEFGPYSGADIQQYLSSGNIVESDLVRAEGTDRWLTVRDIVGGAGAQPKAAAPTPSPQQGYAPAPSSDPMFQPASSPAPYGADSAPAGFDASVALSAGGSSSFGAGSSFDSPASATPVWGGAQPAQPFGGVGAGGAGALKNGAPLPPNMNWVIVLVATIFTCGLFGLVWLFIEAAWFKKLDPQSKGMKFLIFYLVGYLGVMVLSFGGMGVSMAMPDSSLGALISGLGSLLSLGLLVLYILAVFNMKASLEGYFNNVEPINLRLNPILVIFFAVFYFQYHFNRINTWKTTGNLT